MLRQPKQAPAARGAWSVLLLGCLMASAAFAAEPVAAREEASALLRPSHWAVQAAQQLQALGLLEEYLPAQSAVPRAAVRAALEQAAARAAAQDSPWTGLALSYRARFEEEFRVHPLTPGGLLSLEHGSFGLGLGADTAHYGLPAPDSRELRGLFPVLDAPPLMAEASVHGQLGSHLGFALSPSVTPTGLQLAAWEAVVGLSPVTLSFGRTPVGYGLQGERSLVMGGPQGLLRLELATSRPFRLPSFLEHIGWISFETFLSRLQEARHPGAPLLWGTNVRVQPHPRLQLSLQRGVMVGEELGGSGSTASRVLKLLLATKNQRENNVVALSGRWRLPTEAALPLTAYAEWGADDLGAQFKAPGILAGLQTPALPAWPTVSLGGEFAFLGAVCCRTFQWYAHSLQTGGWIVQEAPLGHPLGGDGREYRVYGAAQLLESRLRLRTDVFLRQRFAVNLYGPYRGGAAVGTVSSASWRFASRGEVGVSLAGEAGRHWYAGDVQGRVTLFF